MKNSKLKLYLSVAIISIITTLLTFGLTNLATQSKFANKINLNSPSQFASFNNTAINGNVNFIHSAAVATPAVVHIKTVVQPQQQTNLRFNPFGNIFGDDFFGNSPYQMMPQQSSGSGVIISSDGYIVTNNHVIDNADKIDVVLNDKRTFSAKLIGKDPSTDLALLKIEEKELPFIYFGNSDSVKVGEWVLAVGNPFNLESTVTAGIVSAKGRNINIIKDKTNTAIESFIQTDAAVNPGNSGGALVSTNGELIGINSAIATPTGTYAGYSFAIPVNIVKKVIDDLTNYGVVQRAFLGINPEEMTDEIAEKKGLKNLKGVHVNKITDNGAAAAAGLLQGDIITKIDYKNISSVPELLESVGSKRPGDEIKIEYIRNGKTETSNVQLKNKEGNTKLISKSDMESEAFNSLGASFDELNSSEKSKYKIENGIKISSIHPNGKFAQTDIPEGFIITKVNKKPIVSMNDLKESLSNAKGNIMMEGIVPGYPGKYYFSFNL
ncbi:MAG: hypothetical protein RIQ33_1425 [Bacteroidota bacterium]|jgi:Do/DeqQ family serine protease